ncbi:MAG: hypothetical protein LBB42_05435 [Coriobacteriales bacterium]|jgi:hypothetical protein|nr:hypothetical protein [Coriobacteriales bacterium]
MSAKKRELVPSTLVGGAAPEQQNGFLSETDRAPELNSIIPPRQAPAIQLAKTFAGLSDVRAMAAKVLALTEAQMEEVVYDENLPVVIRRIAQSLLIGDIKEIALVLNQAMGKPVERHINANYVPSAIEQLTTEEIRALLSMCEEEGGGNE